MYSMLSTISQFISEPITQFVQGYEHSALMMAILLGLIGAFAPCQLTGNMSAITFYGNRTLQKSSNWQEIMFFIVGKVVVFSVLGFCAWLFGQSFETKMTVYFPIFRQAIGPMMLVTGLVLIGLFKLTFLQRLTSLLPPVVKEGKLGSFLMGASFSIAFCPTMFVLFFVWLMPLVASTSYGLLLPSIFGIATAVPLIMMLLLIYVFDAKRLILRKSMKMGRAIQTTAGILLILIGITDTITYWGM
ncbi:sulfite exporter TauE/SafE family protein [Lysinibacillus boronitolerans]|uniref:Cytochrome C biosynthesis protein n=1 Tax=Lysinibacillus boronitolerans JCM 21713 = 10a = NBRC 103108 TaxID=1294264 RepID=A0ABR4XU30_9BACI|nr:sulfite exporter TauE/SafE family protein [Lysinibacillus boronitolerans]KGR80992.1 cytochrome C biosynthesis protein [Lysinibacillus boronitolerans JCM 21713 = 10a = NBRC 103108]